ncbi:hypothetical protein D9M71_691080 [compost metagenome]
MFWFERSVEVYAAWHNKGLTFIVDEDATTTSPDPVVEALADFALEAFGIQRGDDQPALRFAQVTGAVVDELGDIIQAIAQRRPAALAKVSADGFRQVSPAVTEQRHVAACEVGQLLAGDGGMAHWLSLRREGLRDLVTILVDLYNQKQLVIYSFLWYSRRIRV